MDDKGRQYKSWILIISSYHKRLLDTSDPEKGWQKANIIQNFIKFVRKSDAKPEDKATFEEGLDLSKNKYIKLPEKDLDWYLYDFTLGLQKDILQEYQNLQFQSETFNKQADELEKKIKSDLLKYKKNYAKTHNGKDTNGDNVYKYQLNELKKLRNKVAEKQTEEALKRMALENATMPSGFGLLSGNSFSYDMMALYSIVNDKRKYVWFGELPVRRTEELLALSITDHAEYVEQFSDIIRKTKVIERIRGNLSACPELIKRQVIFDEALHFFEENKYQPFAYLIVPQMEGLFVDYLRIQGSNKQTRSLPDAVEKVNDVDPFYEYPYFEYDLPKKRNAIAHGVMINVSEEMACEFLMDVLWITDKIVGSEAEKL